MNSMVYRPTIRYADTFKEYVDELFYATNLDRNQIIRAALFSAAFSPTFEEILKQHKKKDVTLATASWSADQHWLWMEQNPTKNEERKDVNANIKVGEEGEKRTKTKREKKQKRGTKTIIKPMENHEQTDRADQTIKRRVEEIPTERIILRNQGGISIKIG